MTTRSPPPLPARFCQARDADEPFWQRQEERVQGATTQPCCTLSGIATSLMDLAGDFAVVIHGEDECASCFLHLGPAATQIYCTGLGERQLISGETAAPLERCLRALAEERRPAVIFVLGSCPVEVIGDPFDQVVRRVAADFPAVTMVPLGTSGLELGSQDAMLDWLLATLASLPPPAEPRGPRSEAWALDPAALPQLIERFLSAGAAALQPPPASAPAEPRRWLNLIGLPRPVFSLVAEHTQIFEQVGVQLCGSYPDGATLDDWRAIKLAQASLVADPSLYPQLLEVLRASGQRVEKAPLPVGIAQTSELYRLVGAVFDVAEELEQAIAPLRAAALAKVDDFKQRHGPLRLALGLRMLNNYRAEQLAYQGLGDRRAFEELGCEVTLLVQGPVEQAEQLAALFAERGITCPFEMFPEPWTISRQLGAGRFDLACLADHCFTEAARAGVPMIRSRSLFPWFDGVAHNLRAIERALARRL